MVKLNPVSAADEQKQQNLFSDTGFKHAAHYFTSLLYVFLCAHGMSQLRCGFQARVDRTSWYCASTQYILVDPCCFISIFVTI